MEYQGAVTGKLIGSRNATREAFQNALIIGGDGWMNMIASRNKTSHAYNKGVAEDIVNRILQSYYTLFCSLEEKMKGLLPS